MAGEDELKRGYPKDAAYDYAWPLDYPYDADPRYPGGSLFPKEPPGEPRPKLVERVGDAEVFGLKVPIFRVTDDD